MNTLLKSMKEVSNYKLTENGGVSYKSTLNGLLDLFGFGAAYRPRSDEDCILLFKNAFDEDPVHALRCLFYLRDCRGGQGERRFFRVCFKWLAENYPEVARKNMRYIPFYGRVDDLYCLVDTPLETEMFNLLKKLTVAAMKEYMEHEHDR